ncbi:uncharacterized protein LOC123716652 isoform X3 [Pieris brassicae]|uniref:uncharacterized protein LOC123716652 isoform X3 n=1 Tax=Pieris brassicae TaxID=7116 RepID=UPI001E661D1C|nr:uncharacterized protein LOC123716652 isoform X3 [Pieris brassicae]
MVYSMTVEEVAAKLPNSAKLYQHLYVDQLTQLALSTDIIHTLNRYTTFVKCGKIIIKVYQYRATPLYILGLYWCSPCGPMICYKYEDCGPPKGRSSDATPQEESSNEKKNDKENQLKRTKSRELRGGIMYYSCHCIKRNGLQHDCRRTGCGGEPSCLVLPDPLCAPSQLARARGLADPAPLAAHYRAQGGGAGPSNDSSGAAGGGKRFIVCELKGIVPDSQADKTTKCCCSTKGSAMQSGNPETAAGLPVLVMKLC